MQYLATIYIDEKAEASYTQADWDRLDRGYAAFYNEAVKQKAFVGGNALEPASTATTVRVRSDQVLLTDGPFAETKEQLGGFFLLDCPSLEAAVALVKLMPGAQSNCVELRAFAPNKE